MRYAMLLAWLVLAVPGATQAQQLREMETDRPNRTNTPSTIDAGHVQFEVGALDTTLDRDGPDERTRMWSLGEVNARIGVTDDVELNVIVAPHGVVHERGDDDARGFGDTTLGLKWNLAGNGGGGLGVAIQPQLKLPTASDRLGNGNVELDVNVPLKADGPAGFGLSVQPTVSWLRSEDDTHYVAGWQLAAAVDHDVGPANVYAEYALSDTAEHGEPAASFLDVGATVQAGDNLTLDAGTEIGLNEGAEDFRVLTGVSVRF